MNCKEGDLAIIVNSVDPEDLGKMVTCVRFVGKATLVHPLGFAAPSVRSDIWEVDREVTWRGRDERIPPHKFPLVPDAYLKPIRPGDMANEVMDRCNVPVAEVL